MVLWVCLNMVAERSVTKRFITANIEQAMSELEVQKMPFVRDELDKLCIEEYAEIFENFLVCDDCPEINEAEDGAEIIESPSWED